MKYIIKSDISILSNRSTDISMLFNNDDGFGGL